MTNDAQVLLWILIVLVAVILIVVVARWR